jgi:tripartite-type tricarboxylate transporter receptor subunit TctC
MSCVMSSKLTAALVVCAAAGASIEASAASAPAYPTKTVRMVVNAAPGGANDVLGRMVARSLTDGLGHNVVVDNRGGAAGNVGAEIVAHAAPDGYTLLYCTNSVVVSPSLYPKLGYRLRELAPVTLAANFPLVITVNPNVPVKNVKELIALARQRGGLSYGSTGSGSVNHLTGVLLNNLAGIDNVHVPYKGAGPMMIALLGGEIEMAVANVFTAAPYVKSGRVHALAVSSLKAVPALPGVPPLAAQFPGFETSLWHGYFITAGTPVSIVALLNTEIVKALRSPAVREAVENGGGETVGNSPEQFAAVIEQDAQKYAKLVKISGAKAN